MTVIPTLILLVSLLSVYLYQTVVPRITESERGREISLLALLAVIARLGSLGVVVW